MFLSSSPISRGRSRSIRSCSASRPLSDRLLRSPARLARLRPPRDAFGFDPTGSFRIGNVDDHDCHFAFRTDDFDGALAKLTASGFREDAAEDDPMRIIVRRKGPAGYPQLFLPDPDRNIIELNGAP
jgi:hypothetical protein